MDNQNKYLLLARRAREENNAEDARKYYDIVRTEDPENAEAKFFYSYYRMMDGTKGEAYNNFISFCNGMGSTTSMIMGSDYSAEEKRAFFLSMANCLTNAYEIALSANSAIGGRNGMQIVDAYRATMNKLLSTIMVQYQDDEEMLITQYEFKKYEAERGGHYLKLKYELGDEIMSKYASMPGLVKFTLKMWKKCIETQQREYGTSAAKECAGFPAKYAEKIKKYEPNYVIPKKAGCISFG